MIDAEFRDLLLFGAFKAAALWGLKALHDASRKRIPDQWEPSGRVLTLNFFPVKSCHSVAVNELLATDFALQATDNDAVRDRHWLILSEDGKVLGQKQDSSLALIRVRYNRDHLILSAPNMDDLRIPFKLNPANARVETKVSDTRMEGIDCGKEAAEWICRFLNKDGFRIVHLAPWLAPRLIKDNPKYKDLCHETDKAPYTGQSAFNLAVMESLDELNTRLETPTKIDPFRPNIVVSGAKAAFDEDTWTFVKIGDAVFRRIRPCLRCPMITVNQDTGIKHPRGEPLATLKSYRCTDEWGTSPMFGMGFAVDVCGTIRVGDRVFVSRS